MKGLAENATKTDPEPNIKTTAAEDPTALKTTDPAATETDASVKVSLLKTAYVVGTDKLTSDLKNFQDFNIDWQNDLLIKFQDHLATALELYKTDLAPDVKEPFHLETIAPWFLDSAETKAKFFPSPEAPSSEQLKLLPTAFHDFQQAIEQEMRPTFVKSATRSIAQATTSALSTLTSLLTFGTVAVSIPSGSSWLNSFSIDFVALGILLETAFNKEAEHFNALQQAADVLAKESEATKAQLAEKQEQLRVLQERIERTKPASQQIVVVREANTASAEPAPLEPSPAELLAEINRLKEREAELLATAERHQAALQKDVELLQAAEARGKEDKAQRDRLLALLGTPGQSSSLSKTTIWIPRTAPLTWGATPHEPPCSLRASEPAAIDDDLETATTASASASATATLSESKRHKKKNHR